METSDSVIVDTSAFYALISEDDRFHHSAVATYHSLTELNLEIWTTSYALVEMIALVHRRLGFEVLSQLLDLIETNVNVFWIDSATHSIAIREFTSAGGRGLSLVDWTIVLAARIKSTRIFAFDRGITNSGVLVVPRQ